MKKVYLLLVLTISSVAFAQMPNLSENKTGEPAIAMKAASTFTAIKHSLFPTLKGKIARDDFFEYMYHKNQNGEYLLADNATFQLGDKSALVQSELVSSIMGPIRISFGSLVTNSKTETTPAAGSKDDPIDPNDNAVTDAFQRLRNNGGNVYLNLELPVYCFSDKHSTAYINMYSRGGIVFSNFSNDVDTSSGNGSTGMNLYLSIGDDYDKFLFFLNANYAYHYGSSEFYQKLNLIEEKAFGFGQITLGVNIIKSLRFGYTLKTFASDESLRTNSGVLSIQLINPF